MTKILLTGGSGALGTCIQKLVSCYAPSSKELDITNAEQCTRVIGEYNPDIIIHSAAWTDVTGAEQKKKECWQVNVTGTENLIRAAQGRRFIYISTEYIFDGTQGNYTENDIPNPINFYALTKLAGELIVAQYPYHLIIRTAFKKDGPWPYPKAFVDQWMSADFASERAPDIVQAAQMQELVGIINISGERKTIYELAKRVSPEVGQMSINDVAVTLPRDTSLNSALWNSIRSSQNPVKK